MQLNSAIKKRKSVVRYSHKKPNWRKIIKAIDAARYAPNAEGHFVMKWIMVSDQDKIDKLNDLTQQPFVSTAKFVVIATSDDSRMTQNYQDKGERYSSLQAGAAIQNFLLELVEQNLVTKWVKYFEEKGVRELFEIPEKMKIEGIFPIGIETKIKSSSERTIDLENYINFDKWGNKRMNPQTRVTLDNA